MQTRQKESSRMKDFDELLRNSLHSFLLPTRSLDKPLPKAVQLLPRQIIFQNPFHRQIIKSLSVHLFIDS